MWIGAHDIIPDGYIETLTGELKNNSDAVLAYSPVERIDSNGRYISSYDYKFHKELYEGSPLERVLSLIKNIEECTLLHGIFRTDVVKGLITDDSFIGLDYVLLCKAAALGWFIYNTQTKYIRRYSRVETKEQAFKRWVDILGEKPTGIPIRPYKRMQEEFIKVVESINEYSVEKNWVSVARQISIERFGEYEPDFSDLVMNISNKLANIDKQFSIIKDSESVAIYGAGIHTENLLKHTCLREKNIIAIVDTKAEGKICERVIRKPNALEALNPDTIIISSYKYQNEIYNTLVNEFRYTGNIIKIYCENEDGPYYKKDNKTPELYVNVGDKVIII